MELLKEFGKLYTGTEWAELDEDSLSLVRSDPFAFYVFPIVGNATQRPLRILRALDCIELFDVRAGGQS